MLTCDVLKRSLNILLACYSVDVDTTLCWIVGMLARCVVDVWIHDMHDGIV
jgi:hypothetical protein